MLFAAWLAAPICSASNSGQVAIPAELKTAFEDARYAIDKGLRAENDANGFSIQFSGAETSIDTGGARVTLALQGYGWGSALHPAGPVTQMEPKGKRLERHYGTALTEWFLNTRQGLEQGFVIAHRAKQAVGALHIRLTAAGGWRVDGSGDRARLMKGAVTLDYAGLKAWDSRGAVIPSRLRGSGTRIEIEVDDAGAVYPLSVDPTFTQQAELTPSDAVLGDLFGVSVGLSSDGNTALVGAWNRGLAYVFTRSGAAWTQQQKLTASDGVAGDNFGWSVGLSGDGNTALVGAYGKSASPKANGSAYVFTRSGVAWTQQQELTASDAAYGDKFGYSVGLSSDGNTALVGAVDKNSRQGSAYVFTRSGVIWNQQQELAASDPADNDSFSLFLGLSNDGNTALVGAPGKNSTQGAAYVFTRSGAAWTQQQELTASDAAAFNYFGVSARLSGDGSTALMGAYGRTSQGAAYVFTRSGAAWTQQQVLTASDAQNGDTFGYSIGLSSDGNTALVGAYQKNGYHGAAYVFTRSGAAWTQQQELTASDAAFNDDFGWSVGLSGDGNTAMVGAYSKNSSTGAAYVFDTSPAVSISINSSPSGLLFGSSGTGCAPGSSYLTPQTLSWTAGSACTITMGSPQAGPPGTRFVFKQWEDDSTNASRPIIAPSSATDFLATFDTQYTLTTLVSPANSGSVIPVSGQFFLAGSLVNLQATANGGYTFANWTGGVADPSKPGTSVIMNSARTVTANFMANVGVGSGAKVGIFRSGFYWLEDVNGDQQFTLPPDRAFAFGGVAGDVPITGDWNGDGTSKVGVYRPANGLFILDYDGDGQFTGADKAYNLGVGVEAGDVPIVGDWNGDGTTKVGLFRQGFFWILDTNGNGVFEQGVDNTYAFGGVAGDVPVVGDWTGDGKTKIGLFRLGFYWILDANGNGSLENINLVGGDLAFAYGGIAGDVPVVGDWNGDGTSKVGVFRQGFFWVLDANGNHYFDGTGTGQDWAFPFGGITGDLPVVGKW